MLYAGFHGEGRAGGGGCVTRDVRMAGSRPCPSPARSSDRCRCCVVVHAREKKPDPKEQVKKWKQQMRAEERKIDRQINSELAHPPSVPHPSAVH